MKENEVRKKRRPEASTMLLQFKGPGIDVKNVPSSDGFGLWFHPISVQIGVHLTNLINSYGREKVKEMILLHFLDLDDAGGLSDDDDTNNQSNNNSKLK